jgi:hypothetical protein
MRPQSLTMFGPREIVMAKPANRSTVFSTDGEQTRLTPYRG